ncbi:TadE family protein [Candidatus Riflebacteria bacterium]
MSNKVRKTQALVEFAIVLPILFLILTAFFDLGRVVYVAIQMETVAEDVSRYIIRGHDVSALKERIQLNIPKGVFLDENFCEIKQKEGLCHIKISYKQYLVTGPMKTMFGPEVNYYVKSAVRSHKNFPAINSTVTEENSTPEKVEQ